MVVENPKISIITINYNNVEGLNNTIQSILNQTYDNIEYIVIDGGSADGSKEIIAARQDDLAHWVSEIDTGVYNAMNKGIGASTGDYLLFINSGDVLLNEQVIEQAVDLGLTHDLVCGNLFYIRDFRRMEWVPADELSFQTFFSSTIPHPCTFIKRDLFEIIGLYNEKHDIVSDWEFFLLATCKYNCTYKHINLFLTEFGDGGLSSDPENFAIINKERNVVLKEHFSYFINDYENYSLLNREMEKIQYFIKARKFIKNIFKR